MARVTVEDCAEIIPSRFELVALAAQRAKLISAGSEIAVEKDNDKDAVIALREIADRKINTDKLRDLLIQSCQRQVNLDQYGVEEISSDISNKEDGIAPDDEVVEEIESLQVNVSDSATDTELLYGEDNIDVED